MKTESSTPAEGDAVSVEYSPKQVKTKVSEIVKKRRDGSEVVYWDVRVGSATAKVYYTPHHQRDFFTVVYWVDDKRKRVLLTTKEAAIEAAKEKCKEIKSGKLVAPDLSAEQRLACARALNIIKPTGLAIDEVANLFWEFTKSFRTCLRA